MAGSTVTAVTFPTANAGQRNTGYTKKRGLRGAAGAVYTGPVLSFAATEGPSSPTHATGDEDSATARGAGGVEDSTGARESDTYSVDLNSGGFTGGPSSSVTRPTRSAGNGTGGSTTVSPTAFIASGVQGGSTPGAPIDTTGRAIQTGVDRFGRSLTGVAYTSGGPGGAGRYTYTNFDGRSTNDGEGGRALGLAGRGTTVDGETVTRNIGVPTLHATAEASGTLAIIDASGKLQVAIHTDDVTGVVATGTNGANGHAGAEVVAFKQGNDTDEDGALVAAATVGTVATDGLDNTDLFTSMTAAAYNVYARWLYWGADKTLKRGPWSAQIVATVS